MRSSQLYEIVFDNHMHLRTDGLFLEAVDSFIRAGGNAINLVNLPDYSVPTSNYYGEIYERTLKMAEKIRSERNLAVVVTIGPYPLDYFHFLDADLDPEESLLSGIDLAMDYIRKGKAHALGEIGRPHFDVEGRILEASNRIIIHGMELSSDVGNPVILHTEDLGNESYKELNSMAKQSNFPADRVVKHHAYPRDLAIDVDFAKSILATRKNVREAIKHGKGFLLETDYVDDPSKPNKVIPPDSVPRRAHTIKQEYNEWEDIFRRTFKEIPTRLYGEDVFSQ